MSNAPAAAADAPAPAKGGKKKLLIIIIAAVVLLAGGGGGAFFMLKKKPAGDEEGADASGHAAAAEKPKAKAKSKHDPKHPPTFVPLEPFTVNLADRESDRYAQVAVTLEVEDAKVGDELKAFMPAVRNNILLLLSHKTSTQMLEKEGKAKLADEIRRETARALGIDVEDPDEEEEVVEDPKKAKKKKKKKVEVELPVTAVHFSNFIIQ
jgi:flagellar FliL protein